MDPNQPHNGKQPQVPAPQSNPYSFITDTQHQPKKKLMAPSGSLRSKIFVIVGGGALLIILVIVVSQLAFGSKANNAKLLTEIVAEQQEIIRVSNIGLTNARDSEVRAFAATTYSSVSSQKSSLTSYLTSKNVKITKLVLNSKKNTENDNALNDATTKNDFDKVFSSIIRQLLTDYANNLKTSYNNASNNSSKSLLADSYNSTATLLKN